MNKKRKTAYQRERIDGIKYETFDKLSSHACTFVVLLYVVVLLFIDRGYELINECETRARYELKECYYGHYLALLG